MKQGKRYTKKDRAKWWWGMVITICIVGFVLSQMGCASPQATLIMSDVAEKKLRLGYQNFVEGLKVEFAFCVYGRRDGTRVFVDDVELMWGVNLPVEVLFVTDYCLDDPFSWGHAHPFGVDSLSDRDWDLVKRMPYHGTLLVYKASGDVKHRYYQKRE